MLVKLQAHGEAHDPEHQEVLENGEFHEPYNDFKLLSVPVPGFHDSLNNIKPPHKRPGPETGPEVT
eukprot:4942550-Prorocentrum_lima.AAC.1